MSRERLVSSEAALRGVPAVRAPRRGFPIAFVLLLVVLAGLSVYGAAAITVRVDSVVFAGSDINLPARLTWLPGLDAPAPEVPLGTERFNLLVLGLDRRPHHVLNPDDAPRSDSISVVSLDPITKTATVVAVPRDLYIELPNPKGGPGFWDTRINAAYHYGEVYRYPGGGAGLARSAVEHNLKIPIHGHVVLDWVAFADIVDALDGIVVDVPERIRTLEGFNPHDGNAFTISIPAGQQPMDSVTALAYARFRDDENGDFGRIQRQQQVMLAVAEKAMAMGWLTKAPQLYTKFRGSIDTDIPPARLPSLASFARQTGPNQVRFFSLAGEDGANVLRRITPEGEDVLVPSWDLMGPALAAALPDRRLQGEAAVVKLVNAGGTRGLAQRGALTLARFGFPTSYVLPVDNDRAERRTSTTITVYGDKSYTAQRIAAMLGVPRATIQQRDEFSRPEGEADVLVLLGSDVRLPDPTRYSGFFPR